MGAFKNENSPTEGVKQSHRRCQTLYYKMKTRFKMHTTSQEIQEEERRKNMGGNGGGGAKYGTLQDRQTEGLGC
jgi:hypothetical protein